MDMPYANTQALREIRKQRELTQPALAEAAEVGYFHLRNVENGSQQASVEVFHRLANVLDVEPTTIMMQEQKEATQ